MKTRNILAFFSAIVSILIAVDFCFAAAKTQKNSAPLPHFFPAGVIQTVDPITQWEESANYSAALAQCYKAIQPDSAFIDGNGMFVVRELFGAPVKIVLDNYVRVDGKIRYTTFCNQGFIGEAEYKIVVSFLENQLSRAVEKKFEDYHALREDAIRIRARQLNLSEKDFRAMLKTPLADDSQITFADLNFIPAPYEKKDFLPRELHLGFMPRSIYAAAWLNSGIVYYGHNAVIEDYLTGEPDILGHELVHSNLKLQNLILSLGFDVEAMASIPKVFEPNDKLDFWFHPYAETFRELALVFFRFDIQRARNDVVLFNFIGRYRIDREKFQKHSREIEKIKKEMREFFLTKTLPAFYADPMFWSGLHERMQDDHLILKVTMAQHYNQTLLGGKVETARWLSEHKDEISRFAHDAYKKSAEARRHNNIRIVKSWESIRHFLGLAEWKMDARAAERIHAHSQTEFRPMTFSELIDFYGDLFTTKPNEVRQ